MKRSVILVLIAALLLGAAALAACQMPAETPENTPVSPDDASGAAPGDAGTDPVSAEALRRFEEAVQEAETLRRFEEAAQEAEEALPEGVRDAADFLTETDGIRQYAVARAWMSAQKYPEIFEQAENANILTKADTSNKHLPVFKAGSAAEFDALAEQLEELHLKTVNLQEGTTFTSYDVAFKNSFFKQSALLLIYVSATSGTYRFHVSAVEDLDGGLFVTVDNDYSAECLADPDGLHGATDDVAGWLLVAEVPRSLYDGATFFDAALKEGHWN